MITVPESGENPVMFPEDKVVVQWKFVPVTLDANGIFVNSPEQIVFDSGELVTAGIGE